MSISYEEFEIKYRYEIKKGIISEACISDLFDLLLEMGNSERRGLVSQLDRLYTHMIKYLYQPYKQSSSCIKTIIDASIQISYYSSESKQAWKAVGEDQQDKIFQSAIKHASMQTGIDVREFPKERPSEYTLENLKDEDFITRFLRDNAYSYDAKKYLGMK